MKRWLAAMMALVLLLMLLPVSSMAAQYATVTGGWLRLRSYPSFTAQTMASYYTGTVVEVLGTSGDWYHVRLSDGLVGYMHGDYLINGTGASSSTAYGSNATVISSNGYGVRLRVGPGTNYRVIRKFPVGTPATILQSGNYWCKISIGGYTGYMMSQFLSTGGSFGSSGSVSYVGDATIWSGNGYGVRLRTGPGKEYSKIGVYSVGTQVKIITKGAVWDYIEVGSRRGYMMNEFLIYNNHYNVNGVTINNLNPVVGNMLAVQSVTPSTATVTYEWLVKPNGGTETVKGTTAAYLVTEADLNCTIRLRVTGAGSYKGTAYSASTAAVVKTGTVDGLDLNIKTPYVGNVLKPVLTPAGAAVTYIWTVGGVQKSNESTYKVVAADVGKTITLRVDGKYPFSGTQTIVTDAVLDVAAPAITTGSLTNGLYQAAYSKQLEANGGGNMEWTLASGSLPAGLSLSKAGVISGTPTECGTKTITVQATNEKGSVTKQLTLTVDPAKVNLPDVNGVAAPALNGTAVTSITANDQYTGTVTWSPALTDGKFAANTVYTAEISLTAKNNYTFTGLTASFFKVAGSANASSTVGSDGQTATVTAVFPATAAETAVKLAKPVIIGIAQQSDAWVISWNAVTNASGYMVRRAGTTPTEWQAVTGTSYTFPEVPASATYQVYAVGDGVAYSNSDPADYVYTVNGSTVQLQTPANVRVLEANGAWTAQWDAVPNAVSYKFRQTNGSNTWHDCTGNSYTFVNAPAEGDTYEVVAVGNGNAYIDSNAATYTYSLTPAQPGPAKLNVPTGLSIQNNGGVWTATWNAVSGATGYRFRKTTSGWHDCTGTSYTFANPPAEGDYEVYAVGDGTTTTDSNTALVAYTAPVATKLAAPTGLSIQENSGVWTATWNSVSGATGYRFRKASSGWHDCSGTSYTFNNPPATDVYEVYAVGDGYTYADSDAATLSFIKPDPAAVPETASSEPVQLGTPAGFSMNNTGDSWTLSWSPVANASGYMLRQTNGTGTWHSCSGSSYTFVNAPQSGDSYEVYAVGDQQDFTNSGVAYYSFD